MIRKMVVLGVALVLSFIFLSVSEAKSLKKDEVYSLPDGRETMEVISKNELEITNGKETFLAEYDFKGDKLRVVANIRGTKMVQYYLIIPEGLKEEKTGQIYYSKAGLKAKEEKQKAEEEKRRTEWEKWVKERFTFSTLTVSDNKTKLMWTRDANIAGGRMDWEDAFKFIENLNEEKYAGYSDWRLPNIEELQTLINFAKGEGVTKNFNEFFNKIGFKNVRPSFYWSSTTSASTPYAAWSVDFDGGNVLNLNKSPSYYVRCVRGGQ